MQNLLLKVGKLIHELKGGGGSFAKTSGRSNEGPIPLAVARAAALGLV